MSHKKKNISSVLLIGAYGNGNLGDVIQARFLSRKIRSLLPEVVIHATSKSTQSNYFPSSDQIHPDILKNKKELNKYDIIAIGGGGILASRHRPFCDDGWHEKIDIPIIFLGVGADKQFIHLYYELLNKAVYIGARDNHSLKALRGFGLPAFLMEDPVLASYSYFLNLKQLKQKKLFINV